MNTVRYQYQHRGCLRATKRCGRNNGDYFTSHRKLSKTISHHTLPAGASTSVHIRLSLPGLSGPANRGSGSGHSGQGHRRWWCTFQGRSHELKLLARGWPTISQMEQTCHQGHGLITLRNKQSAISPTINNKPTGLVDQKD